MQDTKQYDPSFIKLAQAWKAHEEAWAVESAVPRVDKLLESSRLHGDAADLFAEYSQAANTPAAKKTLEAWQHYCLSMKYGEKASAGYSNPSVDRQSIIDDTFTARVHIFQAQELMPWEEAEDRDLRSRWKLREYGLKGLMHRNVAQKLQQEKKYKEASQEFLIAADAHSKAATFAESYNDQVSYQRIMGRVWSATTSAFECMASMSKGRERERYLNEAKRTARQAIQFRPQ